MPQQCLCPCCLSCVSLQLPLWGCQKCWSCWSHVKAWQQRCLHHQWSHRSLASDSTTKARIKPGSWGADSRSFSLKASWVVFSTHYPFKVNAWPWEQATRSVYFPRLSLAAWVGQGDENGRKKVASVGGRGGRGGYLCLWPYTACTPVCKRITPILKSGHKIKSGINPRLL